MPKNAVTSRDLRILVEEAAEPVASENAGVVVGSRGVVRAENIVHVLRPGGIR